MRPRATAWLFSLLVSGCARTPLCPPAADDNGGAGPGPQDTTFVESSDPYAPGPLAVRKLTVPACAAGNPVPLLVIAPESSGLYPIIVFFHGFMSRNGAYSELLTHLASHGFVVVAPQMYEPGLTPLLGSPGIAEETSLAAELLEWLPGQIANVLGYAPQVARVGLAGHSRGGAVVWRLLAANPLCSQAVAGVDPVGGPSVSDAAALQLNVPALVIGCELSGYCAPEGRNHQRFYATTMSPAWHVVIPGVGHLDMLDEEAARLGSVICPAGSQRAAARRLIGGLLTSFFRASLQADAAAYHYLTDPASAPLVFSVEAR